MKEVMPIKESKCPTCGKLVQRKMTWGVRIVISIHGIIAVVMLLYGGPIILSYVEDGPSTLPLVYRTIFLVSFIFISVSSLKLLTRR